MDFFPSTWTHPGSILGVPSKTQCPCKLAEGETGTGEERKGQPWAKGGDGQGCRWWWGGWLPLCCLGPCLLPAGQEAGRGPQDMSQRHQKYLGEKMSQQTHRRGPAFQPPTPSLRRRTLGQVSSPLVPCGSLTGRIGIKKHTSTERSLED